VLEANKS